MLQLTCKTGSYLYYITKAGSTRSYKQVGRTDNDAHGAPIALDQRGDPVTVFFDNLSHWLAFSYCRDGIFTATPGYGAKVRAIGRL